ncbi:hypothetical protein MES5069_1630008 [Mesorhizobium escarrei]|uniref:Uncharacterized protein n=1 Tax=Mesorhizobium escarrei TaxID=666018 RepID=A0ABN8JIN5_9HYPH|nr:hypothetical protein MES5069_1630008 [Mesorhizobium escarrei]
MHGPLGARLLHQATLQEIRKDEGRASARVLATRGGRPGAAHIVKLWPVARGNEFAKGRCQPSDQSPTFHDTIFPWAHS